MDLVLKFKPDGYAKCKDALMKDDIVSRASIVFKEGSLIGKTSYYCYIRGTEEQCKKAVEVVKEFASEIKGKEKEELILKINEEENRASEGMGGIFQD